MDDSVIDPFGLLGVGIDSTLADARQAFARLSLLVHPDKGGDARDMRVVRCAYDYVVDQIRHAESSKANGELSSSTILQDLEGFRAFCETHKPPPPEPDAFRATWDAQDRGAVWSATYDGGYEAEPEAESAGGGEVIIYKEPDPRLADTSVAHRACPARPDALRLAIPDYGDGVVLTDYRRAYAPSKLRETREDQDLAILPSVEAVIAARRAAEASLLTPPGTAP